VGKNRILAAALLLGCSRPASQQPAPALVAPSPTPTKTSPAPVATIEAADVLRLEGKWVVSIRDEEHGVADNVRQYTHYVRVAPSGELFETRLHELAGGKRAVWNEMPEAIGVARQTANNTVQVRWRPENAFPFHVQSRHANGFTLVRDWTLEAPSPEERARMPYPRAPALDRTFTVTMTFSRGPWP
jgi:hypothetical protein